ncbi:MAG: acetate/propionate family kinase [Paracoccaceae bacterium]|nr:acetate/propionate family kinase [Paracoccaceae bacterium]
MEEILVVNAGSSSVKFSLFDNDLAQIVDGSVTGIGGAALLRVDDVITPCAAPDHAPALRLCLAELAARGHAPGRLMAAAHRVVHGGLALRAACRVTPAVMDGIAACIPLAPLHNPANLAAIRALAEIAPGLPQYASFDTAFHATNPEVATRYAIPAEYDAMGIRRYGFHGISYASLVQRLPDLTGQALPRRLLALHLGNGASLCAILAGQSVATTMGYSPIEGLSMGTRAGGIDGNAVLRLAALHGVEGAGRILNQESGLLALGGASDMRALRAMGTIEAGFAVRHFCYWALRHAGSMIAAMGGLDALVFTGGIGENDAGVRAEILTGLAWAGVVMDAEANQKEAARLHHSTSQVAIWTVPAREERQIAAEALAVIAADTGTT